MSDEGASRGQAAARLLARQRLGHADVQQHQVQFASLASGASGQPPAHPRAATAVVDQHRLAVAHRRTQPPEVPPPRPRAVHRVRQPGRHHRLAGDMDDARIDHGRCLGPAPQQSALTAPRQAGDHDHRPRGIRQQSRTSPGPRRSTSPCGRNAPPSCPSCGTTDSSAAPGQTELPTTRPLTSLNSPHSRDERSSHSAQGMQSRDGWYQLPPALVAARPPGYCRSARVRPRTAVAGKGLGKGAAQHPGCVEV